MLYKPYSGPVLAGAWGRKSLCGGLREELAPGRRCAVIMGKGDPNKPRGKMSSYAFFVQTCREEHKKKHPDSSVNFAEFSKKCSERWKTMSAKEKSKFEDLAKSDKARYDREMKNYVPPKGDKKGKKKDPNAPKRPPSAFFLFCSEHRPKIKSEHPGLSIGDTAKKLGEMWSEQSAKDKQPYEQKAAKLKDGGETRLVSRAVTNRWPSRHVHFSNWKAIGWKSLHVRGVVVGEMVVTSLHADVLDVPALVRVRGAAGAQPVVEERFDFL